MSVIFQVAFTAAGIELLQTDGVQEDFDIAPSQTIRTERNAADRETPEMKRPILVRNSQEVVKTGFGTLDLLIA